MDGPYVWRQDPFFLSSLLYLSWEEQQHQHWQNTTRSKWMENVIISSASWPRSLTFASPILPRKPNSVITIRGTFYPLAIWKLTNIISNTWTGQLLVASLGYLVWKYCKAWPVFFASSPSLLLQQKLGWHFNDRKKECLNCPWNLNQKKVILNHSTSYI